jgi:hypothetical protein
MWIVKKFLNQGGVMSGSGMGAGAGAGAGADAGDTFCTYTYLPPITKDAHILTMAHTPTMKGNV